MSKEDGEFFQVWLSWLSGIITGSLISAIFFGAVALEVFLVCALIGHFIIKRLIKKREPQPIVV